MERWPSGHLPMQSYVADNKLSCQHYQRSADVFLGVPFNIARYALLTVMIAQACGHEAHEFIWTGGREKPMDLYTRFRGREPSPTAMLRRSGLLN